jgi:hypothetical protein
VTVATEQPPAAARSGRRRVAGLAAGLLVFGFLVAAVVRGWEKIATYDWQLEPGLLVAGLVVLLAFYLASGGGYVLILEELHAGSIPRRRSLSIWARSLLGRYVPGSVLMVVGRAVLAREAGVPRRVSLAATVYEQTLGLGTAAIGSVIFLAAESTLGHGALIWLVALVPLCLVLLHPRVFRAASARVLRRLGREPLSRFLTARQMVGLAGWYALTTTLLVLAVWALVRSAAGPAVGGPAFVGLAFVLAYTVSMLALVIPSGLGLREGLFALALAQHLPGGVATALSVGLRLVITAVELVFVGACVLLARR